jgi:Sigma-70, region 4
VPHEELMARTLELVEELPDDQRTVVYLKQWLGCADGEIAEELKVSPKTVQRLWARARPILAERMKAWLLKWAGPGDRYSGGPRDGRHCRKGGPPGPGGALSDVER